MTIKRVYVDNSVVSGMFDDHMPERVEQTGLFWQAVIDGRVRIVASNILDSESENAPQHIQNFFVGLPASQIERVVSTEESDQLAMQYIADSVIGAANLNDCRHIALATAVNADAVISWNCDDMVRRGDRYNDVNERHGYKRIEIITPDEFMEVNHDGS